jgi:hypothetical protein
MWIEEESQNLIRNLLYRYPTIPIYTRFFTIGSDLLFMADLRLCKLLYIYKRAYMCAVKAFITMA